MSSTLLKIEKVKFQSGAVSSIQEFIFLQEASSFYPIFMGVD